MTSLEFPAKLAEGRLPRPVAEQIAQALRQAWDGYVVVTVKEVRRPKRQKASRYYRGVIVKHVCLALRDAGNVIDLDGTHILLKEEVGKLQKVVVLPDGQIKYTLRSYAELDAAEQRDYHAAVLAWCAEMGIDVPPPDPLHNQPTNQQE